MCTQWRKPYITALHHWWSHKDKEKKKRYIKPHHVHIVSLLATGINRGCLAEFYWLLVVHFEIVCTSCSASIVRIFYWGDHGMLMSFTSIIATWKEEDLRPILSAASYHHLVLKPPQESVALKPCFIIPLTQTGRKPIKFWTTTIHYHQFVMWDGSYDPMDSVWWP